ncbi:MAG: hypothetical protein ACRDH2_18605, partial [Anaerolineales bacterium]
GYTFAQTDFDLHGLAGIRLLNASPADAAAVTRQLGPIQAPLTREPDLVIRFVDRLTTTSRVRTLGLDEAGFTDDAFLVLRSKHKARARVQIPFEQIGKQCQIVCESGLPAVPLLIPILNLTVLAKGALPLHASAFTYNGVGALTTGWSKGGKTETLLAFMAHGASYIGDEWVYLTGDGGQMYGIPEPIRVWDWHLNYLPEYRKLVGAGDRARLGAIRLAQSLDRALPDRSGLPPVKAVRRVMPLLKRQSFVDMHPKKLFGPGFGALAGPLHKIFFVVSHETPDVRVEPMAPDEVARRMVFSLQHERLDFMAYYYKFRFAFPEAANDFIEQAEQLQRERLIRVLADKPAYAVYHPYPVPIQSLFEAVQPLL